MSYACRIALHLQLASTTALDQAQPERADAQALPPTAGAAGSIQTRQSSAERDLYAEQQQQAAAAPASTTTKFATAAEAAVQTSCVAAEKLMQQLQELGPSATADFMVRAWETCMHTNTA